MSDVTYLTDTNSGPKRHIILGNDTLFPEFVLSEWFSSVRPGEKFIDLRIALINAAMRMNNEDRELLTDNGFVITTIPVIYSLRDDIFASYGDNCRYEDGEIITLFSTIRNEGERCGIEAECVGTCAALSVFEHLGKDIKKLIKEDIKRRIK